MAQDDLEPRSLNSVFHSYLPRHRRVYFSGLPRPLLRYRYTCHLFQGKVEMEMIVVPAVQANEHPVGKGRDPPDPLSPPK